jgi:hypothetical protein
MIPEVNSHITGIVLVAGEPFAEHGLVSCVHEGTIIWRERDGRVFDLSINSTDLAAEGTRWRAGWLDEDGRKALVVAFALAYL